MGRTAIEIAGERIEAEAQRDPRAWPPAAHQLRAEALAEVARIEPPASSSPISNS